MNSKHVLLLLLQIAALCTAADIDSSEIPTIQCPSSCRCFTTLEGLHKASCFSMHGMKKFATNNKHHNINVLDLSHSNLTKINGELDKFTEMVSLDLSNNHIKHMNKILQNSKKLVHLSLNSNLLETFSASAVPGSVSSLNLRDNNLRDVPSDLFLLKDLEHLELKGNPIDCTCENVKIVNKLLNHHVVVDDVLCATPDDKRGKSILQLKQLHVCKPEFVKEPTENMMFGDDPSSDVENVGPTTTDEKLMEMSNDENLKLIGETFEESASSTGNEDEKEFVGIGKSSSSSATAEPFLEGSGDDDFIYASTEPPSLRMSEKLTEDNDTVESGSGDGGSGFPFLRFGHITPTAADPEEDYYEGSGDQDNSTTTMEPLMIDPLYKIFNTGLKADDNDTVLETSTHIPRPNVYPDRIDWDKEEAPKEPTTSEATIVAEEEVESKVAKPVETSRISDTNVNPKESKQPVKTTIGTYICIGIIIAILLGLILVTVIKGRIRKSRERRTMRTPKRDVEKGGKEMVDMNKSLLGKPAVLPDGKDKKMNGNYELVPTHESYRKLPESGHTFEPKPKINAGEKPQKNGGTRPESPILPTSQPKLNSECDSPHLEQNGYSDPEQSEYKPMYSPDMGRVKIKLTETEKPKTPVLINRSRSDAGDIIITPAQEQLSPSKSTT